MPIINFSEAGRILAGSRKSDRPVGGGMRLRYEPEFGYVLRYEPRNSRGADIVKILPAGVYEVTDAGYAGPTTVKKLAEFSPLRYLKPYRRDGRIYFGSPVGRYGMGSGDWITLTPKGGGYAVTGAYEPDPKETPRWTNLLIENYADGMIRWVIAEGRLQLSSSDVAANEVTEYVLSGEPNAAILRAAVYRAGSKKAVATRIAAIEDELSGVAQPTGVLSTLHRDVVNALRSIRKDIEPIITEWIVANGMP